MIFRRYNSNNVSAHCNTQARQRRVTQRPVPSALRVAGNVVFQAVLFYLQHVVEGAVQLLYGHLDWTLQGNRAKNVAKKVRQFKPAWVLTE